MYRESIIFNAYLIDVKDNHSKTIPSSRSYFAKSKTGRDLDAELIKDSTQETYGPLVKVREGFKPISIQDSPAVK